jgi:hypothetical protein
LVTNQCREERQDDQFAAAARSNGNGLSAEQISALKAFVDQLGGIEKARRVLAALNDQQAAA